MRISTIVGLGFAAAVMTISACGLVAPAGVAFTSVSSRVEVHDFVEITATVRPPRAPNCFTDATLDGVFETDDRRRQWRVFGFCDSDDGSVFRIRFMPPSAGRYRYVVQYRQRGSVRSSEGMFTAIQSGRKGPIRVDPEHRWHFIWEGTGEHYFFNGTTAYWLAGWRDDGVILSAIERLHRLKVNRIRVTLAGRTAVFYGEPVMAGEAWTPFITAWPSRNPIDIYHPGFDYSRFDRAHWRKFEKILAAARARDVVISVVLDMNDSIVHPDKNSADEFRFLKYAVARLSAFSNVTWDLGDDLERYRSDAWTRRVGTLLKTWDPYRHLATSHPVDNVHQDRSADWFDFTSFQEWSRNQHQFILEQRKRQAALGRIIPQTNEEYGYEDHYPLWAPGPGSESADTLRRMAWEIVMAGGYQTAGESARRGTSVWPDSGGGWMNGRGDDTMTMFNGYAHMVDFFTSFEWWKTEPHDELVSRGNFCLARPEETYAVYLPNGGRVDVRLAPGRYRATWFEARTGIEVPIGGVLQGGLWTSPPAPGENDWALLIQRESGR